VEQGKFRRDLFYRLNMLSFFIPPLRDRPTILTILPESSPSNSPAHCVSGLRGIDPAFMAALHNYHWPGNVRELENIIRRAVLYCRDGNIASQRLAKHDAARPKRKWREGLPEISVRWTLDKRLEDAERRILEEALRGMDTDGRYGA